MSGLDKKEDWALTRGILLLLKNSADTLKFWIDRINKSREGKHSPALIGWGAALVSGLLLILMLFVPPYLGLSDDGSFARVANPAGIYHYEDTDENLYFNYYVKGYLSLSVPSDSAQRHISSQSLFIRTAKWLDALFTRDNHFDLRFLALLYGILFIPALALLVKQAAQRMSNFSERAVIGFTGVLFFTDVSYITYFSSFYVEAMMYICFLLCIGAALALQEEKHNGRYLLLYTAAGILLITAKFQCAVIGIFLGILCVKFLFIKEGMLWRAGCITCALMLFLSMMVSLSYIPKDFTQASKYHAMTRGVLLQASDPEKALAEFGIDAAYSVLTDTNSNDSFPFINPNNKSLEEGFFNKYNNIQIAYYYMKHPKAMLAMLDISVKSAFNLRPSVSGNYEKSVGMPKMAKSLFWSLWSNFKTRSAPRTIGYIIVLLAAAILLFRQHQASDVSRYRLRGSIPLETILMVLFIGLSQAVLTIVNSGDAEMTQHLFLFSVSIDVVTYFCFAEVLHKINII